METIHKSLSNRNETLPWDSALPRTTTAPAPVHQAWAQEERPNNTAICLCDLNTWLLTDDSQHKQPPALGRSPLFSTVPMKRSWAMLTTWSPAILDPTDPVVLSAPAWIQRSFLLPLCTQYLGSTRLWDEVQGHQHEHRGGQALLHSTAPEPTSPDRWLSGCSMLHIWWCCHRALCHHQLRFPPSGTVTPKETWPKSSMPDKVQH